VGKNMNRFLDGVIAGWQLNTLVTFQSGQPSHPADQMPDNMGSSPRQNRSVRSREKIACATARTYRARRLRANCFVVAGHARPDFQRSAVTRGFLMT